MEKDNISADKSELNYPELNPGLFLLPENSKSHMDTQTTMIVPIQIMDNRVCKITFKETIRKMYFCLKKYLFIILVFIYHIIKN
jgi:hypothetical protein